MRNNEIIKLSLVLFLVTFIVALILAIGNYVTADRIEQLNILLQEKAQKEVLPEADSFMQIPEEEVKKNDINSVQKVYIGEKDGKQVGYCVSVISKGYGGDIEMIVGVDTDGKITGINIVNFEETPGLGSKAGEPQYLDNYINKSVTKILKVVKGKANSDNEISAISGATMTSEAVTKGVNMVSEVLKDMIN
jgi:electron transport complex protein RnfG